MKEVIEAGKRVGKPATLPADWQTCIFYPPAWPDNALSLSIISVWNRI